MSASPSFMQGLLQSIQPWMTGANPSSLDSATSGYGGFQGLLSAMEQGAGPDTSQARTGAALQKARALALDEAASRQQLASGAINAQIMQSKLPGIQQYYRLLPQLMAGMTGAPTTSNASGAAGAPPAGAGGGVQAGAGGAAPASSGAPMGSGGFWSNPMAVMRFGTLGAALGLPGAKGFADYGKTALQYDPATANRMAVAKSQISQDLTQLYQAYTSGDPDAVQGMRTKLKTDMGQLHIGSMSGILTQQNPDSSWTTIDPRTGLLTNTATGSRLLPGAASAQGAMAGAKAGAERTAELSSETAPAGSGIPSGIPVPPAVRAARALQQPPTAQYQGADAVRQEGFIPPILQASSKIPQRPGNTSLGQLQTFQKEQSEKASELADQWNEQSQNAQTLLTQASQIDDAARDFAPNKLADVKRDLMAWGQALGFPVDQKALGSAQEGDKLSIQLQAMVTKQLGSREAAQVFSVMGRSIPSLTLSPDGLGKISAYLKGIAQYQIAQNTFGQRLAAQGNVAGVNGLPAAFQAHSNPVYYILASAPPNVAQEFIANMPATERAKVQAGWKQAISLGLAPAPGDY